MFPEAGSAGGVLVHLIEPPAPHLDVEIARYLPENDPAAKDLIREVRVRPGHPFGENEHGGPAELLLTNVP